MNIDIALLREQIKFLDNYSWRERKDLEFVQGIINLLDTVLDQELGNE
jgi:hypothetical protein